MIINEDLKIESEIPFQQISHLNFQWQINEHATAVLSGVLEAQKESDFILKNYKGSKIKITFKDDILFCGMISDTVATRDSGLYGMEVKAVSLTIQLDREKVREMFQDTSFTYSQMLRELIAKESGELICTIGNEVIKTPFICYEETTWEFAKRVASHINGIIMADVITGKPALWFGFRKGQKIEQHNLCCKQIDIMKSGKMVNEDRISYLLEGRENYTLGDQILVGGNLKTIYDKKVSLERGEVIFLYKVSDKTVLNARSYKQENVIGLSLQGTVEKVKKEMVYVCLDIDGKKGVYPFPWYPETGNILYCMPEKGSKVEIYFMGSNGSEVIATRCRGTEENEGNQKVLSLPEHATVLMDPSKLQIEKKDSIFLTENRIEVNGNSEFKITAAGKIKLKSKRIEINSSEEIKFVTDM